MNDQLKEGKKTSEWKLVVTVVATTVLTAAGVFLDPAHLEEWTSAAKINMLATALASVWVVARTGLKVVHTWRTGKPVTAETIGDPAVDLEKTRQQLVAQVELALRDHRAQLQYQERVVAQLENRLASIKPKENPDGAVAAGGGDG